VPTEFLHDVLIREHVRAGRVEAKTGCKSPMAPADVDHAALPCQAGSTNRHSEQQTKDPHRSYPPAEASACHHIGTRSGYL
jgi:hypothetical protein